MLTRATAATLDRSRGPATLLAALLFFVATDLAAAPTRDADAPLAPEALPEPPPVAAPSALDAAPPKVASPPVAAPSAPEVGSAEDASPPSEVAASSVASPASEVATPTSEVVATPTFAPRFAATPWLTRHRPRRNLVELGVGLGVLLPSVEHELYDATQEYLEPLVYDPVAPAIALRAGFYPLAALGLEAEGMLAPTFCECGGRALLYGARAHLVAQLPLASVAPFALVGAGALGTTGAMGRDIDPAMHFGGGLKIFVNRWLGVRLDARTHVTPAYTREAYRTFHPEVTAGLVVTLGRPWLDSDRDGAPDPGQRAAREDACPFEPGPKNTGGCPDRDGDRVRDADDRCPTRPGPRERAGCPALVDRDGDGFYDPNQFSTPADRVDACPDVAGAATHAGCPVPDRDGDGLDDLADRCPDRRELVNGFEDADGCPDSLPIDVAAILGTIQGIQFGFMSARLTEASQPIIEQAALVLSAYPELKLEIQGHTDGEGDPEANTRLSLRRAESVRRALIDNGVAEDRLRAVGYGGDVPVADNASEAGRARNRRIEFRLLDAQGEPLPTP